MPSSSSLFLKCLLLTLVITLCLLLTLVITLSSEIISVKPQSIRLPQSEEARTSAGLKNKSCPAPDASLYYRPVIGILTHPGDGASDGLSNATNASYIAASYVKFVESGGARVIPIIYNEPPDVIEQKLGLVNGVLFTGGWANTGLYFDTAKMIFENNDILESFNAKDQAATLQFTENAIIEDSVFQRFSPELLKKLSTDCLVMQNHQFGISPERFQNTSALSSFFMVLTTSTDKDEKEYISTAQAWKYPITGFQWHPEKNTFEWANPMIPHSEDAIQVTQNVANFFIREARKSSTRPPKQKVLDNLIYNYIPTYSGKAGNGFDEVYIFS